MLATQKQEQCQNRFSRCFPKKIKKKQQFKNFPQQEMDKIGATPCKTLVALQQELSGNRTSRGRKKTN